MNRRDFLKRGLLTTAGLIGIPKTSFAFKEKREFYGMLVDTTMCIGCHSCEEACAKANQLPIPKTGRRETSTDAFTVVNKFETQKAEVFVKRQCMHCNQPACASACLVKAMEKTQEGPVVWDGNKCLGCRYCMIACPFEMPKFEYNSPNPRIRKCIFCFERIKKGKEPACSNICPTEALLFGKRRELIEIANERIYKNPDRYVHHIYGESEGGGTGWMYLSSVPFEELGFPNIGKTPYPEYTKEFLHIVTLVFLLVPASLLALHQATKKDDE